jgi:hypothetical protein
MHGARGGRPVKHGLYTKEVKAFMRRVNMLVKESNNEARALAKVL